MLHSIKERTILEAEYMLANQSTVRNTALHFGVSKSTVHFDLTNRLHHIDICLFDAIKHLLFNNLTVRHIRGGNSTKIKYLSKLKNAD